MLDIKSLLIPGEEIKYQVFWKSGLYNDYTLYITPYRIIVFDKNTIDIILINNLSKLHLERGKLSLYADGCHSYWVEEDNIELLCEIQREIMKAKFD